MRKGSGDNGLLGGALSRLGPFEGNACRDVVSESVFRVAGVPSTRSLEWSGFQ